VEIAAGRIVVEMPGGGASVAMAEKNKGA